jgi:hypothetical protein
VIARVPWVGAILVAVLSFAVLVVSRPHHGGGQLEIIVAASNRTPVLLRWDSGDGFNQREQTTLVFGLTEPLPNADHVLMIKNRSRSDLRGSEATMVVIRDIVMDGSRRLNLESLSTPGNSEITEGGLLNVFAGGEGLAISEVFSSVEIVFVKGPFGGEVEIEVDDDRLSGDLYETYVEFVAHRVDSHVVEGLHTRLVPLPRSDLFALEIEPVKPGSRIDVRSLRAVTDSAAFELTGQASDTRTGGVRISDIDLQTRTFSLFLVVVQFLVAVVLGGLCFVVLSLPRIVGRPNWRSTLRHLTVHGQRWVWWLVFLSTAGVFSFWLLGQWPGAMQNDSLALWTQLKTLEIDNMMPWLHAVLVLALIQIADTPAIISIVQVLVSAILGASILYFAYLRGVSRAVIAVFWFLFAFSIPVGLYNVTMFKDLPFAQCTLLWGFLMYWLWAHKRDRGAYEPRFLTILAFSVLLMGFLVRHNGFLFIFAIPLLIMVVGLLPRRAALRFLVISWTLFVVLQFGIANLIGVHKRTSYARLEFWMKAGPVFGLFANPGGYYTDDPAGDRRRIEEFVDVESITREYRRGSFEPLFYRHRSEDAVEVYRDLSMLYDHRTAENAPILIGDKAYLFATIIGPFRETYLWSNDLRERRFLRNRLWWNRRFIARWGEMTMLHRLAHEPRSALAYKIQEKIWNHSHQYAGLYRGRFVYWNAILPLLVLVGFLAAYRFLPGTALFSLVVLFQVPFVFLAATAYHYRFIFFVHYCGFFVVPLALAEIRSMRTRTPMAGEVKEA